ncbi:MAG TPA: hypothetical protein VFW65_04625 [Pseudonocardiaceae bacterium]|nr:hypothetical protein [Pseudonocardiaceae bacterium]
MRRTIALAAFVLTGLLGLASFAQAAQPRPGTPTCLIANGGGGGYYTKALTCVELVANRYGDVGTGRYTTAPGSGQHTLTVTVEYQRSGYGYGHRPATWVPLASATTKGKGNLSANTTPVRAPRQATTRACVTVSAGHTAGRELCTR